MKISVEIGVKEYLVCLPKDKIVDVYKWVQLGVIWQFMTFVAVDVCIFCRFSVHRDKIHPHFS